MCKRCNWTDESGRALPPTRELECSWCDDFFMVCRYAAEDIAAHAMSKLCTTHYNEFMGRRIGDFAGVRIYRADQERDVDANGWLSNAIRLLEDPVERPVVNASDER